MLIIDSVANLWYRFVAWIRGEPRRALPEIKFVDNDGMGWRERPDYQEAHTPDHGQHETWKREMRIFLFRARTGDDSRQFDLRMADIGDRTIQVPPLYPLGMQLAEACRRLGFSQLARSAMPDISDAELERFYIENEKSVEEEARRRYLFNIKTASSWDEVKMGSPFIYESTEQTIKMLTVGPLSREGGEPLLPIQLGGEANFADYTRARNARPS